MLNDARSGEPLGPRSGRGLAILALLAIGAGAAVVAVRFDFVKRARYGSAEIPVVDTQGLEKPLAARIAERRSAVAEHPYSAEAWGALAMASDVHELYPTAIASYERAEKLDPKDWRWPYFLGIARRIGDQRAAIADFRRAAALKPDYAPLRFYLGHGLLQTEQLDAAEVEFAGAADLDPKLVAPHLGLAKIALAGGDHARALAELDKAQALGPKSEEIRWLYAQAWRAAGDSAKAAQYAPEGSISRALEPVPDVVRAEMMWNEGVTARFRRQRAEGWLERKEPERAVAELASAVQESPQSLELAMALGDLYSKLGRGDDACTAYAHAVEIAPDDPRAVAALGAALLRKGDTAKAADTLRRALELDPKNVEAKNNLGALLAGSGKPEEGLELLKSVVEATPEDVDARFNYAQGLRSLRKFDEAREQYTKAIELAPDRLQLRFELGMMLASANDFDGAAREFREIIAREPMRSSAHSNLILSLLAARQHQAAIDAARAAADVFPKELQFRGQLAWMLATSPEPKARNGGEAVLLAQALCDETKNENPEMLVIHGAALAETGDLERAIARIGEALELLKPKQGGLVSDPKMIGVIDRAQACLKAFRAGEPYHEAE
jgi:tetratricopeptide (TPR) repeat protein